jgi:hypothetical protein
MRILTLSTLALLATCCVGYYADAQPGQAFPIQAFNQAPAPARSGITYHPTAPYVAPATMPTMADGAAPTGQHEANVAELARTYGKTLDSAVRDNVITDETAQHLVAEVELLLSVKKARLELLRTVSTLDTIDRERQGVPGWEEAHELRKLLPKMDELKLKVDAASRSLPRQPSDPTNDPGR